MIKQKINYINFLESFPNKGKIVSRNIFYLQKTTWISLAYLKILQLIDKLQKFFFTKDFNTVISLSNIVCSWRMVWFCINTFYLTNVSQSFEVSVETFTVGLSLTFSETLEVEYVSHLCEFVNEVFPYILLHKVCCIRNI